MAFSLPEYCRLFALTKAYQGGSRAPQDPPPPVATPLSKETMCNARVWSQQGWESCAILLRYASAITELKKYWELRNNSQQHATTCNRVCKRTQLVTTNNVASV